MLGLSVKSIDRAIQSGNLKALRAGAQVFVPLNEFERFRAAVATNRPAAQALGPASVLAHRPFDLDRLERLGRSARDQEIDLNTGRP
jgi:hypothetical protein